MNETEQYLFWLLIFVLAFLGGAFGVQLFFWRRNRISDWMETTVMPSPLGRLRPVKWISDRLYSDMAQDATNALGKMYVDYGWIVKNDTVDEGSNPFFKLAHALLTLNREGYYSVEYTANRMTEVRLHLENHLLTN